MASNTDFNRLQPLVSKKDQTSIFYIKILRMFLIKFKISFIEFKIEKKRR